MSALLERQWLFAACLGKLLVWINAQGWAVTLAEGYVGDSINKPSEDTPHLRTGNHFKRLAQDLNLFVDGQLVKDGAHPAWQAIGAYWKGLHPECAWGGDFAKPDANHVSLAYQNIR
jgi:hypothetical protein